jgi:toxin-antitoxin system PIN domain toxin
VSELGFLFDANLWVALAFLRHPHRPQALAVYTTASAERPALFCRATQQSFLRLASTPALLQLCGAPGLTNHDALTALDRFMALPSVQYREEPAGLVPIWHRLSRVPRASPKIWMDAYLAAFAIAGNVPIVTLDRDFKAFEKEGLKLQMP